MARPAHAKGHPECQHKSWAACDKAQQMRFGQCAAVTGDREPTPCVRWAINESGWCWQHYASELERQRRAARQAIISADLSARIEAYLRWTRRHPSVHDRMPPPRKPPFRIDAP